MSINNSIINSTISLQQNNINNYKKPIIYVDFDNTIVNSTKQIVKLWKRRHNGKFDYKTIDWTEIYTYKFTELNMSHEELMKYFDSLEFFNGLEYNEGAYSTLKHLSDIGYKIKIVSIGTKQNLLLKAKWLKEHFDFIYEYVPVFSETYKDKSHIDMSDGILIDDNSYNLCNSNAKHKICFGEICEWNENWTGKRIYTWYEFVSKVYKYN